MESNTELDDELEALTSIFGNDVTVEGPTTSNLSSSVTVSVRCGPAKRYELEAWLPAGYPITPPVVKVHVDKQESEAVTEMLQASMEQPHPETPILFELITWIEDHAQSVGAAMGDLSTAAEDVTLSEDEALLEDAKPPPNEDHEDQQEPAVTPRLDRQWIWFIGFYTKAIIKKFCAAAADLNCSGFLMPGKPAVSAIEGTPEAISEFLRVTRTELFAKVPPASRKMKLCLLDRDINERSFVGFEELTLHTTSSAHKRKDMADLGRLETYLSDLGLSHAFNEIFDSAVRS